MDLPISLSSVLLISAMAINIFLILAVLRDNFRSATNLAFAILNFVTSLWLVAIYISFNPAFLSTSLFWVRLSVFLAVPQSIMFFLLAHTLPGETLRIRKGVLSLILILAIPVMILTISPYVFTKVEVTGNRPQPIPGPGMAIFAPFVISFSVAAVYLLVRKMQRSSGVEKQQFRFVAFGILVMLGLIIVTILIGAALLKKNVFVAFAPLYTLIFLGMTAYAIVRHHLFNLKVIATEALTIMIWIALLSRLAVSESTAEIIINLLILAATIIFGVLLIKSVRREVEQREELARLNVQLEKRNKQVEELSQFKTQLLSLASHQVKAPLAAIKGFASILLEGLYGKINDKVKETVEKMKRSSDSLLSLVNTLLDLRRIEEGRIEYSFTKVKFADLVREVVSGLEPLAKQKNLELSFQSSSDATINADTEKLKSVIQNLVENAIKYTPSGFVRTELKDEPSGDTVLLTVADSGLGIEEDLLPHLFEEFIREERVKREIRGTGLGLYVARRFIEAHGGQIWAESEGENKGSRFYIRLKKA